MMASGPIRTMLGVRGKESGVMKVLRFLGGLKFSVLRGCKWCMGRRSYPRSQAVSLKADDHFHISLTCLSAKSTTF